MVMGERQVDQSALFYEFSLEKHVPADHMLRSIDSFVDLGEIRTHLAPFYSTTGRPLVDPELLIRMLIIGYCYDIRSERQLCEEVHLNPHFPARLGSMLTASVQALIERHHIDMEKGKKVIKRYYSRHRQL
jgi:transposase